MILQAFNLCVGGNGFGLEVKGFLLEKFCKDNRLSFWAVLPVLNKLIVAYNDKKKD